MSFTSEEKRDMLDMYYSSHKNCVSAAERYLEQYPERRQPHRSYYLRLHRNLGEYGSFEQQRGAYGSKVTVEIKENILDLVI